MKTMLGILIVLSACASCSHLRKTEQGPPSGERRSALHDSFSDYLKESGNAPLSIDMVDVAFTDLNDDGIPDAIVLASRFETGFAGSGGGTMFVFAGIREGGYRFISHNTITRTPIHVRGTSSNGWRDIVVHNSGGGYRASHRVLAFDGNKYPLNPSLQPKTSIVETDVLVLGNAE